MNDLRHTSTEDLLAELKRRVGRDSCSCGELRRETVHVDPTGMFLPRKGCLTCNKWDEKPQSAQGERR